jgi:tetratricopeptide (TPR) repeat protein
LLCRAADIPLIRGQLQGAPAETFPSLFVTLEEITSHVHVYRVDVRFDGSFEFRGIPTGDYTLRVTDLHGLSILDEPVTAYEHMAELEVRLPAANRLSAKPGTVSLAQLIHPPARKAVHALQEAARLSEAGKYAEAAAMLEQAIRISPAFAAAYTNLAVQHLRLGRLEDSVTDSERALGVGGPDPLNFCNLAVAQFQLQRFAEAEASARAALRLDSGYPQGHLVLGSILMRDPATRDEATRHLQLVAGQFPSARAYLNRVPSN